MSYQEYPYEYDYEMEPEPGQDNGRLTQIVGGLAVAAAVGCACILCVLVVFAAGFEAGSRTNSGPTPTSGSGQPPEAVIVFPPEAAVGQQVTFDGSASRPGGSPIANYQWDFGDGTLGSGPTVAHIYNAPATYQVTLTVTGQDGLENTGEPVAIAIKAQQAPEPIINFPPEATVGEPVTFDGSQSQPGSSPIAGYDWNFGDGTGGSGATVTHIYNTPGIFQIALTVTGQDGIATTGGPVQIVINPAGAPAPPPATGQLPQPVLNFLPEARVGEPVTFDGSQSQPGSSPIANYEWNFGDGTTASGAVVTYVYNSPGTYQVTLTITGQDGSGNTGGPTPISIVQ